MELRCAITGNLCGTDTWGNDNPCQCLSCRRFLVTELRQLQAERAALEAENEKLNKMLKEAVHAVPEDDEDILSLQKERDALVRLLLEVHGYLYNPFEPDNQSAMYKKVGAELSKIRRAHRDAYRQEDV